jgi:hypothetical protein
MGLMLLFMHALSALIDWAGLWLAFCVGFCACIK